MVIMIVIITIIMATRNICTAKHGVNKLHLILKSYD